MRGWGCSGGVQGGRPPCACGYSGPHHAPPLAHSPPPSPSPLLSSLPPSCWGCGGRGEGRGEACGSGTFLTCLYPFFPHLLWDLGWGYNHLGLDPQCGAGSSHPGANLLGRSWAVIGMCQITAPVTWGAPSNTLSPGVSQSPSPAGFSFELLYPPSPTPLRSPGVGASPEGPSLLPGTGFCGATKLWSPHPQVLTHTSAATLTC